MLLCVQAAKLLDRVCLCCRTSSCADISASLTDSGWNSSRIEQRSLNTRQARVKTLKNWLRCKNLLIQELRISGREQCQANLPKNPKCLSACMDLSLNDSPLLTMDGRLGSKHESHSSFFIPVYGHSPGQSALKRSVAVAKARQRVIEAIRCGPCIAKQVAPLVQMSCWPWQSICSRSCKLACIMRHDGTCCGLW